MTGKSYDEFRELLRTRSLRPALELAEREAAAGGSCFWHTQRAVALTRLGDFATAMTAAEEALRREPSNPYALLVRADALKGAQRFPEALAGYLEVADEPRTAERARNGAAECLARLGRWQELLERVHAWMLPETARLAWTAKALAAQGRIDDALKACGEWLQLHPDHSEALWLIADLETRRDGPEATRSRYARLAKIPSRPPVYREIYAWLCRRCGDETTAADQYARVSRQTNTPSVQRQRAFALAKSGQEAEAIAIFEELLRAAPDDMYVNNAYRATCRRIGASARAVAFYTELLALHPQVGSLHGRLRNVHKDCGSDAS